MEQLAEGIVSEKPLPTSAYAGHQPGRYMGKAIQAAGELSALIQDVENPFAFFYAYQRAAVKLGANYPKLSPTTLAVLAQVEQELIAPAK